jgi:hypothetical protein
MTDEQWHYLKCPFLFSGYFECDYCHRPIFVRVQLQEPNDWQGQLFDVRCDGCGRGTINRPGREVAEYSVVHWNRQIRSVCHTDGNAL